MRHFIASCIRRICMQLHKWKWSHQRGEVEAWKRVKIKELCLPGPWVPKSSAIQVFISYCCSGRAGDVMQYFTAFFQPYTSLDSGRNHGHRRWNVQGSRLEPLTGASRSPALTCEVMAEHPNMGLSHQMRFPCTFTKAIQGYLTFPV